MKYLCLFILLGGSLMIAADGTAPPPAERKPSPCVQIRHTLNPLNAVRKLREGVIDLAVDVSSIGIEQPADKVDPANRAIPAKPAQARACRNEPKPQLSALLGN